MRGPFLHPGTNVNQSPYSVPMVSTLHEPGICEFILVFMVLLLWLYSFYRLYLVWQKTLNFSEASIQGPQGWDLVINWVMERIQVHLPKICLIVLTIHSAICIVSLVLLNQWASLFDNFYQLVFFL